MTAVGIALIGIAMVLILGALRDVSPFEAVRQVLAGQPVTTPPNP